MKIVAFGDSLTAGCQSPSPENPAGESTPYGHFLKELMGAAIDVIVSGINGEVTSEMVVRIDRDVVDLRPDYAVILGGTNDLGWNRQPREIMQNLSLMYERCQGAGIAPIAVTVPSIRGDDRLIPVRQALNGLIRDYCRAHTQPYVDLFHATAEQGNERLAESYSNDGLHLTTAGYRVFAECLHRELVA